jgi:predicted dehydrogenase
MTESVLAIIGGGRWGQVMLSVVATMYAPFDRTVIVSHANAMEVRRKIADLNLMSRIPIEILPTIEDLFAKYEVKAAVIVNSAGQHFATARQLINRGVNVLIEKPIVPSIEQMQILIKEAKHHHVSLVPGLSYRFCSYIKNFSHEAAKKGIPQQFHLKWCDAKDEIRYGQVKRHDISIGIVHDVMPHIWTILSVIFQHPTVNIHTCLQDNNSAALTLSINCIEGQVLLERNGSRRERYLALQFDSDKLVLDFSIEPGVMVVDSKQMSADQLWEQKPGPLARQLEYFFSVIAKGKSTQEDLQCCLDSVACTEFASAFSRPPISLYGS